MEIFWRPLGEKSPELIVFFLATNKQVKIKKTESLKFYIIF